MIVRRAAIADAVEIAAAEAKYIDCPWSLAQVQEEIANPQALFYVAENENGFIGYLSGVVASDECEISNIAVDEAHRRNGVASRLFCAFIRQLKEENVKTVFLLVRDGNVPAIKLYEKHGFEVVGKRPRYYKGGDALIMRLDI